MFAIGPAGTGKTYLAMAMAVRALQERHPATAAREERRRGQAVVAPADDRHVERAAHSSPERSNRRAASSPGAPITPPPGWVPEAHDHSPRSGVRYRAQPESGR